MGGRKLDAGVSIARRHEGNGYSFNWLVLYALVNRIAIKLAPFVGLHSPLVPRATMATGGAGGVGGDNKNVIKFPRFRRFDNMSRERKCIARGIMTRID